MKSCIIKYLHAEQGPIKRPALLKFIRMSLGDMTITDRAMRKMIEQLITDDGYLIQSSHLGYSLIRTEDELMDAMSYLDNKAESISIRKNCLLRNFRKHFKREPVCQPLLFG